MARNAGKCQAMCFRPRIISESSNSFPLFITLHRRRVITRDIVRTRSELWPTQNRIKSWGFHHLLIVGQTLCCFLPSPISNILFHRHCTLFPIPFPISPLRLHQRRRNQVIKEFIRFQWRPLFGSLSIKSSLDGHPPKHTNPRTQTFCQSLTDE